MRNSLWLLMPLFLLVAGAALLIFHPFMKKGPVTSAVEDASQIPYPPQSDQRLTLNDRSEFDQKAGHSREPVAESRTLTVLWEERIPAEGAFIICRPVGRLHDPTETYYSVPHDGRVVLNYDGSVEIECQRLHRVMWTRDGRPDPVPRLTVLDADDEEVILGGAVLAVTVVRDEGAPAPGAVVYAGMASRKGYWRLPFFPVGTTDSSGHVEIRKPASHLDILAVSDGVRMSAPFPVSSIRDNSLTLKTRYRIGRVRLDIEDVREDPPPATRVVVWPQDESLPAFGAFMQGHHGAVCPCLAGPAQLVVDSTGRARHRSMIAVDDSIERVYRVELEEGWQLSGKIGLTPDMPFGYALVSVGDQSFLRSEPWWIHQAQASAAGEFALRYIPTGGHEFRATAFIDGIGAVSSEKVLDGISGDALRWSPTIQVLVYRGVAKRRDGRPASEWWVRARPTQSAAAHEGDYVRTGQDGSFALPVSSFALHDLLLISGPGPGAEVRGRLDGALPVGHHIVIEAPDRQFIEISGIIVDWQNVGVQSARVQVMKGPYPTPYSARSGAGGDYALSVPQDDLKPSFSLVAERDDLGMAVSEEIMAPPGSVLQAPDLVFEQAVELDVVVNSATYEELQGVIVTLEGCDPELPRRALELTTLSTFQCRVQPGRYVLEAQALNGASARRTVSARPGDRIVETFTLSPGVWVTIRCAPGGGGIASRMATLQIEDEQGADQWVEYAPWSDREAGFTVRKALAPGSYRLTVTYSGVATKHQFEVPRGVSRASVQVRLQ